MIFTFVSLSFVGVYFLLFSLHLLPQIRPIQQLLEIFLTDHILVAHIELAVKVCGSQQF